MADFVLGKLRNCSDALLGSWAYGYNLGSQRTNVTRTDSSFVNYAYDPLGQLKTALGKEGAGATRWHEQFGYAYDAAGNLNLRTNNDLVQAFNVNSLNELSTVSRTTNMTVAGTTTSAATNVTVNGLTAALYGDYTFARTNIGLVEGNNIFTAVARDSYGRVDTSTSICYLPSTNSYTYDLDGNLLTDGTRNFAYGDENQLTSVWVTNVWRSGFVYDGKMRRRIRREYTWSSGSWLLASETRYIHDGMLVIQERDANNLPLVSYTRGRDLSGSLQGAGGIGGLLARSDNHLLAIGESSASAFYHADGNGNIICLINSSNVIVAKYLYDPFGSIISQSGPLADVNLYRCSSKEYHVASGMYYYGYRFYDPGLQRWINRDPIAERDGQNLYRFVGNDPVGHLDFLGLCRLGFSLPWETEIVGVQIRETFQPSIIGFTCHFSKVLIKRLRCYSCQNGKLTVHIEIDDTDIRVMISPGGETHAYAEGQPQVVCRAWWDSHRPPEYVPQ